MKPFPRIVKLGIVLLWVFAGWQLWPSLSLSLSRSRAQELVSITGGIRDYAVSSQGLIAVTGGESTSRDERRIVLVDKNGSRSETMTRVANGTIERIHFSPDGRKLFGSSQWGLWSGDIQDGKIVKQISTPAQKAGRQSYWSMRRVGQPVQRDDATIECIATANGFYPSMQASFWKLSDLSFVRERTILPASRGPFILVQSVLSPDGTQAVAVWRGVQRDKNKRIVKNGLIELWDITNTKMLRELEEINSQGLGPLVFSSDAKYIAAADSAGNGYIWDTQTGQLVQSLSGLRHKVKGRPRTYIFGFDTPPFDAIIPLVFTADNRIIIAATNDGSIIAYSRESGLPVKLITRRGKTISSLRLSPDNRNLLFFEDRKTLYSLPLPEFPAAS